MEAGTGALIRIQEDALDLSEAYDFLRSPAAGGIDLFVGTTRRWTGSRETTLLTYTCYEPLARTEMRRLAEHAAETWPVERVCLLHRVGPVPIAEASVIIGVAAPHRAAAFEACRWLIDTLKRQVPIWKQEHLRDGTRTWIEGDRPPSVDL